MTRRRAVPILVAVLALALFWWTRRGGDESPLHVVDSDVRQCTTNLQAIYDGLRAYNDRFGKTPEGSGVAFIAELVASGVWENTEPSVLRLTCPGPSAHAIPENTNYLEPASLSPASSAYAGRNTRDHPLATFPSGGRDVQALVACDNANGMNHEGVMNVLYSDRTVKTFVLDRLIEQGTLPAGALSIPVGSDSPIEELRTLVPD